MVPSDARTAPGLRRHRRPFGAGLVLALGGAEILLVQRAGPAELLTADVRYLVPLLMVLCGVLVVADPRRRRRCAAVGVLASLASWVASDLGGFLLGAALGILGGALALGGAAGPVPPGPRAARPDGPA
ncbi:DUF6114 domain-containing protein [Streptomyces sp. NPDC014656]|uniref:DUF6114 domain-containing protein n=1 Tax=Streptomyces sp. NPDC014656 TaxID=3364878 RepID=UPI003702D2B8